ncbi:hypothetical protein OGAPHI_002229 [Ogataea philodendri]|uniref:WW domain-containing protein n=1 Tax=Ogataea philodendri TaxID=1378263 RepID=A0A9P8PB25_9ASCO|nr:uncharacterized protein OGAPHI_002229 [Ogataea philodendri]KAH3668475.1 hypothetical protein OGAPHI_002229 [Ogataea philodendri]
MFPKLIKRSISHDSQATSLASSSDRSFDSSTEADIYSSLESLEDPSNAFEKLPQGWNVRYDPVLQLYYYVNFDKQISQFDSPLEVVKH